MYNIKYSMNVLQILWDVIFKSVTLHGLAGYSCKWVYMVWNG